jgi:hypothetical protein
MVLSPTVRTKNAIPVAIHHFVCGNRRAGQIRSVISIPKKQETIRIGIKVSEFMRHLLSQISEMYRKIYFG